MPGSTNRVHRKTPRRLTEITRSHSLTSSSAKQLWRKMPASLTRMSTWPNSASAASDHRPDLLLVGDVGLHQQVTAAGLLAIEASTGAAASAPSTSAMTTSAPSAANAVAISPADAAGAAGDDGDLACQLSGHGVSLGLAAQLALALNGIRQATVSRIFRRRRRRSGAP